MLNPSEIVSKMYENDAYSQWLGIEIDKVELGTVELSLEVRSEMLNGFQVLHGGISYALADSAFAFASNSLGYQAVSIETSISHLRKVGEGEVLRAYAQKLSSGRSIGVYEVQVYSGKSLVASFRGTVAVYKRIWD